MAVRHIKDPIALAAILRSQSGGVAKDMMRRGFKVANAAKRNLEKAPRRVDTGLLRSSIKPELLQINGAPAVRVGTNVFYAIMVHDGTGVYGPKGVPITPKVKKIMMWKKGGKKVYANVVQGMKPNPFLKDALPAAKD